MSSASKTPFVEQLPCKLTPAEKEIRSDEMARLQLERERITLEKSLSAQRYAKDLKEAERRMGELAEQVRTGVEYREVRVEERRNFEQNVIQVFRLDTNTVCGERAMRSEERQAELFPKGKPKADGHDDQLDLPDGEELGPDDDDVALDDEEAMGAESAETH